MSNPYSRTVREKALLHKFEGLRFGPAVAKTDRGMTEPLCAYLRSEAPLDREHRETLAHLIERRIAPKERGRLPDWPTPRSEMRQLWIALVRRDAKKWRASGPELPRGKLIEIVEKWGAVLAEDGELHGINPITAAEILQEVRRGSKQKIQRMKVAPKP